MKVSVLHTAGDAPVRNRERVRAPGGLSKRRGKFSSSWHVRGLSQWDGICAQNTSD